MALSDMQLSGIERLAAGVRDGNVVAFVGAGFAAPAVPSWLELLERLNDRLFEPDEETYQAVASVLEDHPGARDLEAAAQLLEGGRTTRFRRALREVLDDAALDAQENGGRDTLDRRIDALRGIPFKAVLTTNFDGLLGGADPAPDLYRRLLRPQPGWWDESWWGSQRADSPVVTLHGEASDGRDIVFTRRDYLRRVHEQADYRPFLRAILMTHTVFFLGFSFTDAYINELRAETLTVLEGDGGGVEPLAYALVENVSRPMQRYLRFHDGIQAIPIATGNGDYRQFDDALAALRDLTDPGRRLGRLLDGASILWVDPNEANNERGVALLEQAAARVDRVPTPQAARAFAQDHGTPGLIITRWGHRAPMQADALDLLELVRTSEELRAPVVVFASGLHAHDNAPEALRHGATSYEWTWSGLFREIERIFAVGSDA